MARYVDAFVLPISRKKVEAYRRIAALAGKTVDMRRMAYGGFSAIVDVE